MLNFLDQCKAHGGPVTKTRINILEDFTFKYLQIETLYLKKAIAPNIKIKHRSDVDPVTNKSKMSNVIAEQFEKEH